MRLQRNKTILGLLCILVCLSMSACDKVAGGEKDTLQVTESSTENGTSDEPFSDVPVKKFDISLPQDITMELLGLDILRMKRSGWEEYIFTMQESDEYISYYTSFFVRDCEIIHSHKDIDNKSTFVSDIHYKDKLFGARVEFNENNNVSGLSISTDMGDEFSTSFLNISDSAKKYMESIEPGIWDRLLAGELVSAEQGYHMVYYTSGSDVFQIFNEDIEIAYFLENGLVDYIYVVVKGNISQNAEDEDESSIYYLDQFDYYLYGADIATMSARDWLDLFNFKEYKPEEAKFKEVWMNILDFSKKYTNENEWVGPCDTLLAGEEVLASISYYEQAESKSWSMSMYSAADREVWLGTIYFMINKQGYISFSVDICNECPMITSNFVLPGDNIKTVLNSYEDGLYEQILSLDNSESYCIGPYEFMLSKNSESSGGSISIVKKDEGAMDPIAIDFEDEIVTRIGRTYRGSISDFDEKLSLQ